jgi:hypothetical protein
MTKIRTAFLLTASVLLTACAGMSEQACLVSDWTTVGFEDGVAGRPVGSIGRYRQMCGKHGVAPDLASYRAGHSDGVQTYCRPGNGFEVGRRGSSYQNVCPADMEGEFLTAYDSGYHLYELETALRRVEAQLTSNDREQHTIKQELTAIAASMVSNETTGEERVLLVARAAELGARHGELTADSEALEEDRVLHERDLLDYRQTLAAGF